MKKNKAYIGFIAPGFILYTLFMIVPIFCAIYYSFFKWNGIGPMEYVGFGNFETLLFNPRMSRIFFNALGNNIKYLMCVWFIITPIQFFFAYCLYMKIKAHRYIRFMLFLPYVVSTSIVGFFSILIFDPNIGLLNNLLATFHLADLQNAWLGDPSKVFTIFVCVVIWQAIGSGMMIFYANMKEISNDIIEAATLDGVNQRQKFFYIVLPQCIASILTNVVLGTIFALTIFDIPFMLGGPGGGVNNKIDFVNMVFYRYAFGGSYFGETSLGFGSAISVLMFIVIMAAYLIQQAILKRHEFEQ